MVDSVLTLKMKFDKGEVSFFEDALPYLNASELMQKLLVDFDSDTLGLLIRLVQIAEIPYSQDLPKVKSWLRDLVERSYFGEGFSYSGKRENLLVCYHSMITSVLIRLQYHDKSIIDKGIEWILKYQNTERGIKNNWDGSSILKYGGCMKLTPCYVGLVKSMVALSDYKMRFRGTDEIDDKLKSGLDYILSHNLYLKKSNSEPITKYITKLSYPFFYKINLIELLRLMKVNGLINDERCDFAKNFLSKKKKKAGYWQVNSILLPKHWVVFDKTKEKGEWISYEIECLLEV